MWLCVIGWVFPDVSKDHSAQIQKMLRGLLGPPTQHQSATSLKPSDFGILSLRTRQLLIWSSLVLHSGTKKNIGLLPLFDKQFKWSKNYIKMVGFNEIWISKLFFYSYDNVPLFLTLSLLWKDSYAMRESGLCIIDKNLSVKYIESC
jgi:hypothetical protein